MRPPCVFPSLVRRCGSVQRNADKSRQDIGKCIRTVSSGVRKSRSNIDLRDLSLSVYVPSSSPSLSGKNPANKPTDSKTNLIHRRSCHGNTEGRGGITRARSEGPVLNTMISVDKYQPASVYTDILAPKRKYSLSSDGFNGESVNTSSSINKDVTENDWPENLFSTWNTLVFFNYDDSFTSGLAAESLIEHTLSENKNLSNSEKRSKELKVEKSSVSNNCQVKQSESAKSIASNSHEPKTIVERKLSCSSISVPKNNKAALSIGPNVQEINLDSLKKSQHPDIKNNSGKTLIAKSVDHQVELENSPEEIIKKYWFLKNKSNQLSKIDEGNKSTSKSGCAKKAVFNLNSSNESNSILKINKKADKKISVNDSQKSALVNKKKDGTPILKIDDKLMSSQDFLLIDNNTSNKSVKQHAKTGKMLLDINLGMRKSSSYDIKNQLTNNGKSLSVPHQKILFSNHKSPPSSYKKKNDDKMKLQGRKSSQNSSGNESTGNSKDEDKLTVKSSVTSPESKPDNLSSKANDPSGDLAAKPSVNILKNKSGTQSMKPNFPPEDKVEPAGILLPENIPNTQNDTQLTKPNVPCHDENEVAAKLSETIENSKSYDHSAKPNNSSKENMDHEVATETEIVLNIKSEAQSSKSDVISKDESVINMISKTDTHSTKPDVSSKDEDALASKSSVISLNRKSDNPSAKLNDLEKVLDEFATLSSVSIPKNETKNSTLNPDNLIEDKDEVVDKLSLVLKSKNDDTPFKKQDEMILNNPEQSGIGNEPESKKYLKVRDKTPHSESSKDLTDSTNRNEYIARFNMNPFNEVNFFNLNVLDNDSKMNEDTSNIATKHTTAPDEIEFETVVKASVIDMKSENDESQMKNNNLPFAGVEQNTETPGTESSKNYYRVRATSSRSKPSNLNPFDLINKGKFIDNFNINSSNELSMPSLDTVAEISEKDLAGFSAINSIIPGENEYERVDKTPVMTDLKSVNDEFQITNNTLPSADVQQISEKEAEVDNKQYYRVRATSHRLKPPEKFSDTDKSTGHTSVINCETSAYNEMNLFDFDSLNSDPKTDKDFGDLSKNHHVQGDSVLVNKSKNLENANDDNDILNKSFSYPQYSILNQGASKFENLEDSNIWEVDDIANDPNSINNKTDNFEGAENTTVTSKGRFLKLFEKVHKDSENKSSLSDTFDMTVSKQPRGRQLALSRKQYYRVRAESDRFQGLNSVGSVKNYYRVKGDSVKYPNDQVMNIDESNLNSSKNASLGDGGDTVMERTPMNESMAVEDPNIWKYVLLLKNNMLLAKKHDQEGSDILNQPDVSKRSILDLFRSVDKSTVVIQKDFYTREKILRKIKEEDKMKKQPQTANVPVNEGIKALENGIETTGSSSHPDGPKFKTESSGENKNEQRSDDPISRLSSPSINFKVGSKKDLEKLEALNFGFYDIDVLDKNINGFTKPHEESMIPNNENKFLKYGPFFDKSISERPSLEDMKSNDEDQMNNLSVTEGKEMYNVGFNSDSIKTSNSSLPNELGKGSLKGASSQFNESDSFKEKEYTDSSKEGTINLSDDIGKVSEETSSHQDKYLELLQQYVKKVVDENYELKEPESSSTLKNEYLRTSMKHNRKINENDRNISSFEDKFMKVVLDYLNSLKEKGTKHEKALAPENKDSNALQEEKTNTNGQNKIDENNSYSKHDVKLNSSMDSFLQLLKEYIRSAKDEQIKSRVNENSSTLEYEYPNSFKRDMEKMKQGQNKIDVRNVLANKDSFVALLKEYILSLKDEPSTISENKSLTKNNENFLKEDVKKLQMSDKNGDEEAKGSEKVTSAHSDPLLTLFQSYAKNFKDHHNTNENEILEFEIEFSDSSRKHPDTTSRTNVTVENENNSKHIDKYINLFQQNEESVDSGRSGINENQSLFTPKNQHNILHLTDKSKRSESEPSKVFKNDSGKLEGGKHKIDNVDDSFREVNVKESSFKPESKLSNNFAPDKSETNENYSSSTPKKYLKIGRSNFTQGGKEINYEKSLSTPFGKDGVNFRQESETGENEYNLNNVMVGSSQKDFNDISTGNDISKIYKNNDSPSPKNEFSDLFQSFADHFLRGKKNKKEKDIFPKDVEIEEEERKNAYGHESLFTPVKAEEISLKDESNNVRESLETPKHEHSKLFNKEIKHTGNESGQTNEKETSFTPQEEYSNLFKKEGTGSEKDISKLASFNKDLNSFKNDINLDVKSDKTPIKEISGRWLKLSRDDLRTYEKTMLQNEDSKSSFQNDVKSDSKKDLSSKPSSKSSVILTNENTVEEKNFSSDKKILDGKSKNDNQVISRMNKFDSSFLLHHDIDNNFDVFNFEIQPKGNQKVDSAHLKVVKDQDSLNELKESETNEKSPNIGKKNNFDSASNLKLKEDKTFETNDNSVKTDTFETSDIKESKGQSFDQLPKLDSLPLITFYENIITYTAESFERDIDYRNSESEGSFQTVPNSMSGTAFEKPRTDVASNMDFSPSIINKNILNTHEVKKSNESENYLILNDQVKLENSSLSKENNYEQSLHKSYDGNILIKMKEDGNDALKISSFNVSFHNKPGKVLSINCGDHEDYSKISSLAKDLDSDTLAGFNYFLDNKLPLSLSLPIPKNSSNTCISLKTLNRTTELSIAQNSNMLETDSDVPSVMRSFFQINGCSTKFKQRTNIVEAAKVELLNSGRVTDVSQVSGEYRSDFSSSSTSSSCANNYKISGLYSNGRNKDESDLKKGYNLSNSLMKKDVKPVVNVSNDYPVINIQLQLAGNGAKANTSCLSNQDDAKSRVLTSQPENLSYEETIEKMRKKFLVNTFKVESSSNANRLKNKNFEESKKIFQETEKDEEEKKTKSENDVKGYEYDPNSSLSEKDLKLLENYFYSKNSVNKNKNFDNKPIKKSSKYSLGKGKMSGSKKPKIDPNSQINDSSTRFKELIEKYAQQNFDELSQYSISVMSPSEFEAASKHSSKNKIKTVFDISEDTIKSFSTLDLNKKGKDFPNASVGVINIDLFANPIMREKYSSVPSVSKILNDTMPETSKQALNRWKLKMISSMGEEKFQELYKEQLIRGKDFHDSVKHRLMGKSDLPEKLQENLCLKSIEWILKDLTDIIAVESFVVHPSLGYKGIFDCVAKYKGKPVLIEWKHSSKVKNKVSSTFDAPLQMTAYMGALAEDKNYNVQVDGGLVVVAHSDGSPAEMFQVNADDCQTFWTHWLQRLSQFVATHQKKSPS